MGEREGEREGVEVWVCFVVMTAVMIHPTAIVAGGARLGAGVVVGPYAVIDEGVELGAGCVVGPHVYLTGWTTVGEGNRFHAGCVIGDAPQDLKYNGEPTELRIGARNVFREHVTVHRSCAPGGATRVGSDNLLMAGCHVAHDSQVGDKNVLANGALLGGHVTVMDRVVISGNCLLHQFVRVGTLAMMQGGAAISKDLPPFTVARGQNHICGLNTVGLRRAGFDAGQRLELRRLYHALFRSGRRLREAWELAQGRFATEPARLVLEFVAESKRGLCADVGRGGQEED